MPNDSNLRDFLINQEGKFFKTPTQPIRRDGTPDILTIGYGRDVSRLSEEEKGQIIIDMLARGEDAPDSIDKLKVDQQGALDLLYTDINSARKEAENLIPNISKFSQAQQDAVAAMIYQLGAPRFSGFSNLIGALNQEKPDFKRAAKEIKQGSQPGTLSGLAQQSGPRRIAALQHMLSTGEYPKDKRGNIDFSGESLLNHFIQGK